jgi:hypothetical protein
MSPKSTRKLLVKLKKHDLDYKDWIALRESDRASNRALGPYKSKQINKMYRKFEHELTPTTEYGKCPVEMKDLAISGKQIQELLGIGPSQIVGVILQYLFDRTVIDPSLNTPEKLKELVVGKPKKLKNDDCWGMCPGRYCVDFGSSACPITTDTEVDGFQTDSEKREFPFS